MKQRGSQKKVFDLIVGKAAFFFFVIYCYLIKVQRLENYQVVKLQRLEKVFDLNVSMTAFFFVVALNDFLVLLLHNDKENHRKTIFIGCSYNAYACLMLMLTVAHSRRTLKNLVHNGPFNKYVDKMWWKVVKNVHFCPG